MSKALHLHIKKILDASPEATTDIVYNTLLRTHIQYKLNPVAELMDSIGKELLEFRGKTIATMASSSSTNNLMSLNRTMSSTYIQSDLKRQKLVDPNKANDETGTESSILPVIESISEEQTEETKVGDIQSLQTSKKIVKKVNKKKALGSEMNVVDEMTKGTRSSLSFLAARPTTRLSDLAGLEPVMKQIEELVFFPVLHPDIYKTLGVTPPCGILLHGPSGCGKTTLACAIAGELNLPFFKASGPELVGGTSGESEERIRQIFETAAAQAPSVLFIDALDVIAAKKESSQRGMERRIVAQLFDSIDYISSLGSEMVKRQVVDKAERAGDNLEDNEATEGNNAESVAEEGTAEKKKQGLVVLIVATNKPDSIDPGVRGRFSREIALPVPDAPSRTKILQLMTAHMLLSPLVDFVALGKATPGFVGADLQALTREAGMIAVSRIVAEMKAIAPDVLPSADAMQNRCVQMSDFTVAAKTIQPTAKREGFAVAPDVTWSDVGALKEVREELLHNVLEPIAHPERFRSLGLEVPAGVLFFGPPGCGKTLLAKALANQSGANFISVKGPELLNMYVGESESRVRQVFTRARASAPCVIFFDELDALCPKRGSGDPEGGGSGNGVSERVVNQLLTELDGLESRRDVYIIAATNRLELIDDAMLRPGRLGKLLYVPLPSTQDRVSILKALTRKVSVHFASPNNEDGVDLEKIGSDVRSDGFSGADLAALVREAGLAVVREVIDSNNAKHVVPISSSVESDGESGESVSMQVEEAPLESKVDQRHDIEDYSNLSIRAHHFETAFLKVKASVSELDRARYVYVQENIKNGMGAIEALKDAAEKLSKLKKLRQLQLKNAKSDN